MVALCIIKFSRGLFFPAAHAKEALDLAKMQEHTLQLTHQEEIKVYVFITCTLQCRPYIYRENYTNLHVQCPVYCILFSFWEHGQDRYVGLQLVLT